MNLIKKLKSVLFKTSNIISSKINNLFNRSNIDKDFLEELEECLLEADISFEIVSLIISELKKYKFDKNYDANKVKDKLSEVIEGLLTGSKGDLKLESKKLNILLIIGVNGSGKTTCIGKMANKFYGDNLKVMIAACDTYRAAAVSQLEIWANKSNSYLIKGEEKSDPASVVYQAIQKAQAENYDILMVDTAGRLHNNINLMNELNKIVKVINKIAGNSTVQTMLIIDATTGQNVIRQVKEFQKSSHINGLIITKLDSSAKGGMLISIYNEFKIPIYFIGTGEKIEDLEVFDPNAYAKSIFGL